MYVYHLPFCFNTWCYNSIIEIWLTCFQNIGFWGNTQKCIFMLYTLLWVLHINFHLGHPTYKQWNATWVRWFSLCFCDFFIYGQALLMLIICLTFRQMIIRTCNLCTIERAIRILSNKCTLSCSELMFHSFRVAFAHFGTCHRGFCSFHS